MNHFYRIRWKLQAFKLICLLLAIPLSGCATVGPKTISSDRPVYDDQIAESWKKQMLLNIVKLRYADMPTFLDVSSVIAQYGIEQEVNGAVGVSWPKAINSNGVGVGGYYRYSDRPTITYTPLSGQKFIKNLLTPIPPMGIISMIQSGWPIDLVFSICVKSINGKANYSGRESEKSNEEFLHLITLWRDLQNDNVTDFRVEKTNEGDNLVCFVTSEGLSEESRTKLESIIKILGVKPNNKYSVVFGKLASNDTELALLTRSMLDIMIEMSYLVEVPEEHRQKKYVKEWKISGLQGVPLMRIHSGPELPADAFVAMPYQGHWFWIANNDFPTKTNFTLLMIFLSLTETEQKTGAGPLISIN